MLGKRLVTPGPELAREEPADNFNRRRRLVALLPLPLPLPLSLPPRHRRIRHPAQNRGEKYGTGRAKRVCRAKRAPAIALPRESAPCALSTVYGLGLNRVRERWREGCAGEGKRGEERRPGKRMEGTRGRILHLRGAN